MDISLPLLSLLSLLATLGLTLLTLSVALPLTGSGVKLLLLLGGLGERRLALLGGERDRERIELRRLGGLSSLRLAGERERILRGGGLLESRLRGGESLLRGESGEKRGDLE